MLLLSLEDRARFERSCLREGLLVLPNLQCGHVYRTGIATRKRGSNRLETRLQNPNLSSRGHLLKQESISPVWKSTNTKAYPKPRYTLREGATMEVKTLRDNINLIGRSTVEDI